MANEPQPGRIEPTESGNFSFQKYKDAQETKSSAQSGQVIPEATPKMTDSGNYSFQEYKESQINRPGAPQPGRIAPKQVAVERTASGNYDFQKYKAATEGVKIPHIQPKPKTLSPTGAGKISNVTSLGVQTAAKVLPKSVKSAIDVGVGVVAGSALIPGVGAAPIIVGKIIDARIRSTNRKDIEQLRDDLRHSGKGHVPQTKKRISTFGQVIFIGFAILVDITEIILDAAGGIGILINRILDPVVGLIFLVYALFKGLSISDNWAVFESIIGTIVGEFIPGFDILPFFTADAFFITHTIKNKDKARQAALEQEAQSILDEQNQQNWMREYQQNQAAQAEQDAYEEQESEEEAEEDEDSGTQRTSAIQTNSGAEGRIQNYSFQKAKDAQTAATAAKQSSQEQPRIAA